MALICLNGIRFICAAHRFETDEPSECTEKLEYRSWGIPGRSAQTLTGAAHAPIRLARLVGRHKSLWARANSG